MHQIITKKRQLDPEDKENRAPKKRYPPVDPSKILMKPKLGACTKKLFDVDPKVLETLKKYQAIRNELLRDQVTKDDTS